MFDMKRRPGGDHIATYNYAKRYYRVKCFYEVGDAQKRQKSSGQRLCLERSRLEIRKQFGRLRITGRGC